MATASKDSSDRRKIALLIGNGNYNRQENKLSNATDTIKQFETILKQISFDVTTVVNASKAKMNTGVNDFVKKIQANDLVLIYYYGHGCQVDGKNYLIPTDDDIIENERDVEDFGVNLESTFSLISKQNSSYVSVWILDCCRPYLLKHQKKSSLNAGLCEMKAPKNVLIEFAGAANQVVSNDLFTKRLLANIAQENVELNDIFQGIKRDVYQESHQQQNPFISSGLDRNENVFLYGCLLTTEKFLTTEKLTEDEKVYYDECKEYYHLTHKPLVAVADEVLDNSKTVESAALKIGIDQDCRNFNLLEYLKLLSEELNIKLSDIVVKKIQQGSAILEAELFGKCETDERKIFLKMVVNKITDRVREEFGRIKTFFMFLGPIKSLAKLQKRRADIRLNPAFNRIYVHGHDYWEGPNNDNKDRGGKPYFCPLGWQRWSLHVTDHFDAKFKGWCIGYHGTKFEHGLSILMSGLKPAEVKALGEGVYLTPSINYAAHPRYSEVKQIDFNKSKKFFKQGRYIQFVLECRVHPSNITTIGPETLRAKGITIDPNILNNIIEWVIDTKGKEIIDFNDPNSMIVCTGLLRRVTDKHPCFLPQSDWWFQSLLAEKKMYKNLNFDFESLLARKQRGETCEILFNT